MVLKVAVEDRFQFKVVPNFRNFCLLKQSDVHYIGGTDVLPAPLAADEEADAISKLGTQDEKGAKSQLIEHNLRLVVYIAKKFDNTGVGVEDLISIGTIGLIKAINSYNPEKNIKLATYASRCIENAILSQMRLWFRTNPPRAEKHQNGVLWHRFPRISTSFAPLRRAM